jgi:hypothetical protein
MMNIIKSQVLDNVFQVPYMRETSPNSVNQLQELTEGVGRGYSRPQLKGPPYVVYQSLVVLEVLYAFNRHERGDERYDGWIKRPFREVSRR